MAPNISKKEMLCATPEKVSGPQGRCDLSPVVGPAKSSAGSPTIVQRTSALLRGLNLIFEHHDAPTHLLTDLDLQVHSYLDTSISETVWLKRCKHLLTYPLARYLKNDPPPKPDQCFSPTGRLRRWIKPRLNAFGPTNTHLWYSWYQSKRCTLPLSEDIIDETYSKHLETLTSPDRGDDEVINQIFSDPTFLDVIDQVRGMVTAQFRYGVPFEKLHPKTSACFEQTRSQGGQQTALRQLADLPDFTRDSPLDYSLSIDEMVSMVYEPWVYTKVGRISNYHLTQTAPYGEAEWDSLRREKTKVLETISNRSLNATIQAVLEPNKVRVISKGEALPYYMMRPLQKALFESLKTMSCFKLISRPLNTNDIFPLCEKAKLTDNWFSVDYSAATDGLSWKYSGKIFKKIIELLPEEDQRIALSVLGPHNLYYPDGRNPPIKKGIMTSGQLMGSILSFPILCLANLGVYLLSTQGVQQGWSHQERLDHVLINGDDMVYASDPTIWNDHVRIGKSVGLEMSIGKAYVHREYLNINSTSIHCALHRLPIYRKDLKATEIGYLNCGLFFGQHKVQGKKEGSKVQLAKAHLSQDPEDGIVVNINCLLKGSRPGRQSKVLKKLLEVQGDIIGKECKVSTRSGESFSRNLFIPLALGGMGVSVPSDFRFRVTKEECYVALGYINELPDCSYTSQLPLPGFPLDRLIEKNLCVPWGPKDGGDVVEKPRIPVTRAYLKQIRHYCRVGFHRYVPFRSCAQAPAESPIKYKFIPHVQEDNLPPYFDIIKVAKSVLAVKSQTPIKVADRPPFEDVRSYFQ